MNFKYIYSFNIYLLKMEKENKRKDSFKDEFMKIKPIY